MTNREDPLAGAIELAQDLQHPLVVAQVLGRASADAEYGDVICDVDLLERQV